MAEEPAISGLGCVVQFTSMAHPLFADFYNLVQNSSAAPVISCILYTNKCFTLRIESLALTLSRYYIYLDKCLSHWNMLEGYYNFIVNKILCVSYIFFFFFFEYHLWIYISFLFIYVFIFFNSFCYCLEMSWEKCVEFNIRACAKCCHVWKQLWTLYHDTFVQFGCNEVVARLYEYIMGVLQLSKYIRPAFSLLS